MALCMCLYMYMHVSTCACMYLYMYMYVALTLSICGSIVSLFQAVSSDAPVVHTAKVLPAGMHLYECISGNDIIFQPMTM